MAKSLSEHRKSIKPEVQKAARYKAVEIITQMSLAEARKARGYNQIHVAQHLNLAQSNVSQIESRPDVLLSTLQHYVNALGGKLELHAKFPDGQDIEITQFTDSLTS